MKIFKFVATLFGALSMIGPIRSIRIMRLGAKRIALFRDAHGREPTDAEWIEISRQVDAEINHLP